MTRTDPPDNPQQQRPLCPTDHPTDPMRTGPMTTDDVHESLRDGVDGHLPSMAALELLIAHGSAVDRLQNAGLIEWSDPEHHPPMAWIDWYGLDDQLSGRTDLHQSLSGASRSAHNLLRIATSLVTDHQISLNDVLHGLDATNTSLVARAVANAYGHGRPICLGLRYPVTPRAVGSTVAVVDPASPRHPQNTNS